MRRRRLANRFPGALQVSARTGEGLAALRARLADRFAERFVPVRLVIPHDEGRVLARLYELGTPIEQRVDRADGVHLVARLPRAELPRLAPYLVSEPASSQAERA